MANNDTFYLIINREGKFNYSNKGFQNSPHYIALATAKYRAKDLILSASRFFDPQRSYHVERALELKDMKVRTFKITVDAEMLIDRDQPDMTLREFVDKHKMESEVDIYDKLMQNIPSVIPAAPPKQGPVRIATSGIQITP